MDEGVVTWSTNVSVGPLPKRKHMAGRYEVRVIVYHVYDLKAHGHEIFPDVYVKARIKGQRAWK